MKTIELVQDEKGERTLVLRDTCYKHQYTLDDLVNGELVFIKNIGRVVRLVQQHKERR